MQLLEREREREDEFIAWEELRTKSAKLKALRAEVGGCTGMGDRQILVFVHPQPPSSPSLFFVMPKDWTQGSSSAISPVHQFCRGEAFPTHHRLHHSHVPGTTLLVFHLVFEFSILPLTRLFLSIRECLPCSPVLAIFSPRFTPR
jgi:hypothetical protein